MQIHCPVCDYSRTIDLAKIPSTAEFATCPKCHHRFRFRAVDLEEVEQSSAQPKPDPDHADVWDAMDSLNDSLKDAHSDEGRNSEEEHRSGPTRFSSEDAAIPWENPRYLGAWQSFLRTAFWVLFHPTSFFSSLNRKPFFLSALGFYLIFGCLQYVLNIIWAYVLGNMARERFVAVMGEEVFEQLIGSLLQHSLFTIKILSVPFQLAIQLFLTAGLVHLLIRIISPKTSDFSLAFKIVSYASVSFVLVLIPIAGAIIAPICYFTLLLIGCRAAFTLPWANAILVVTPLYLLLFFIATAQYTQFLNG